MLCFSDTNIQQKKLLSRSLTISFNSNTSVSFSFKFLLLPPLWWKGRTWLELGTIHIFRAKDSVRKRFAFILLNHLSFDWWIQTQSCLWDELQSSWGGVTWIKNGSVHRDLIRSLIILCTEPGLGHEPFGLSIPLWRTWLQLVLPCFVRCVSCCSRAIT